MSPLPQHALPESVWVVEGFEMNKRIAYLPEDVDFVPQNRRKQIALPAMHDDCRKTLRSHLELPLSTKNTGEPVLHERRRKNNRCYELAVDKAILSLLEHP